jgi:hypothetical protein
MGGNLVGDINDRDAGREGGDDPVNDTDELVFETVIREKRDRPSRSPARGSSPAEPSQREVLSAARGGGRTAGPGCR